MIGINEQKVFMTREFGVPVVVDGNGGFVCACHGVRLEYVPDDWHRNPRSGFDGECPVVRASQRAQRVLDSLRAAYVDAGLLPDNAAWWKVLHQWRQPGYSALCAACERYRAERLSGRLWHCRRCHIVWMLSRRLLNLAWYGGEVGVAKALLIATNYYAGIRVAGFPKLSKYEQEVWNYEKTDHQISQDAAICALLGGLASDCPPGVHRSSTHTQRRIAEQHASYGCMQAQARSGVGADQGSGRARESSSGADACQAT